MSQFNPFRQATYALAAHHLHQLPADVGIEVAIAGRSNAGKSSALNRLTGQKTLARTSKTPGRTQQIVIFDIAAHCRIADLPGYGYAKVPLELREHWKEIMQVYFDTRRSLRGVALVMDIRHPLKPFDAQMIDWCVAAGLPCHVLLTKADKLKRGPALSTLAQVRRELPGGATAQVFSAKSGEGLDEWVTLMCGWFELSPPSGKA